MIHLNRKNQKRFIRIDYRTDCGTVQTVLLVVSILMYRPGPAARQIFSYNWGAADWGEWHMFIYVPERSFMYTLQYPVDFAKKAFFRKKCVHKFGHRTVRFNHKIFDKSPQCHGGSSWSNVGLPCTVIRFVRVSAILDTCTVVSVNGTLVKDKMSRFNGECAHKSCNKSPIYTHDGASAIFSTNSLSLEPCRYFLEHYTLSLEPWRFTLEHEKLSQEPWRLDLEH
jgi:hypothetical protein